MAVAGSWRRVPMAVAMAVALGRVPVRLPLALGRVPVEPVALKPWRVPERSAGRAEQAGQATVPG